MTTNTMNNNTNTANATNVTMTANKHYPVLVKACDGTPVRVSVRLGKSLSRFSNCPPVKWCAMAYRDILSWDYYIPTQYVGIWIRIKRFEVHNNVIGEPWRFRASLLLFVNEQSLKSSNKLLIGHPIKEIVEDYKKELAELDLC